MYECMKLCVKLAVAAVALGLSAWNYPAQEFPPDFQTDGPPPLGAGGPPGEGFGGPGGPGGFGGPMGGVKEARKLVQQFDKNGDGWLNNPERKAAREYLAKQGGGQRMGGPRGRRGGFGPFAENQEPAKPGLRIAPAQVKSYPDALFYASNVLRTLFLEFENADWEKELGEFHGSDVEVPARLTVDGKTFPDVGVRFHGASSYMMVSEGRKRSLHLSMDLVHEDQNVGGYRTLNLLNSHEDPTFLRTILSHTIARAYLPAPKANLVRLVINGESWGVYVSSQQFNKDFVKEWFGTRKGARWKVPGSPNGHGSLAYLGDDPAPYKRIYEIKSKDDAKSWVDLIKLCKVLSQTPAAELEQALAPLLDIDGALKFLALENVLVNNDGYWTRASDYDIYQDEKGHFHIIPYDANETFSTGGGPGGPGGPGGGGGPRGFGPGMMVPRQMLIQADKDGDSRLNKAEFGALAEAWFSKLDPDPTGKISSNQFSARLDQILPLPQGRRGFGLPGEPGTADGGRGAARPGFGPGAPLGSALFFTLDANKDGSLTQTEIKETFARWFNEWDADKTGVLTEERMRSGLAAVLPQPGFGRFGPGGGFRGPGGPGFGGGPRGGGIELDPLVAASDSDKTLISKLLAVPSLRTRYLGYVRDIADKWLDWNRLGPIAAQYQTLITDEVKNDTRRLDSFEAFQAGIAGEAQTTSSRGPGPGLSLKTFAEKRRAFLLNYPEIKKLAASGL